MKIVYAEDALRDLDQILAFVAEHYPTIIDGVEERIRAVMAQVAQWPESRPRVSDAS